MNEDKSKYVVSWLALFSEDSDVLPEIRRAVQVEGRPSLGEAIIALWGDDDEDDDDYTRVDDETWEASNEFRGYGEPILYQLKIQTANRYSNMVDDFIARFKRLAALDG